VIVAATDGSDDDGTLRLSRIEYEVRSALAGMASGDLAQEVMYADSLSQHFGFSERDLRELCAALSHVFPGCDLDLSINQATTFDDLLQQVARKLISVH
jgi:hypothetical protein